MAHFAKISEENIVLQVLTLDDKDMLNGDGVATESVGQAHLQQHNNWPAHLWIQTSYNTRANTHSSGNNAKAFRGNYAGIGFSWDAENNIFWCEKPYDSWVKNTSDAQWHSPIGDASAFTTEQTSQNSAGTHAWRYVWNEDNTRGDLTDLYA